MPYLAAALARHEGARKYAGIALSELGYDEMGIRLDAPEAPHSAMAPAKIVELMRAGAGSARVCEEGAKALLALSFKGEAQAAEAGGAGAIAALVASLRAHGEAAAVAAQACGALANMCHWSSKWHAQVVQHGGVPLLVNAANLHEAARSYAHITLKSLGYSQQGTKD